MFQISLSLSPYLCQYTYLLTSQLESQRLYFEEKLTRVEEEAREQVIKRERREREKMDYWQIVTSVLQQVILKCS